MKRLLLPLLIGGFLNVYGQVLDTRLDGTEQGRPVEEILQKLEKNGQAKFFYLPEWLKDVQVEESYKDRTLGDLLLDTFEGSDITYVEMYGYALIFSKDPSRALEREKLLRDAVAEQKKIQDVSFGEQTKGQKNRAVTLRGKVLDLKLREPVSGASVTVSDLGQTVTTDANGDFAVTVPAGGHVVVFRYLSYEERVLDLKIFEDATITVELNEVPKMLDEVVINDQHLSAVSGRIGQTNLKLTDLKKLPTFLGEVDIIKQIQILPGVTSVGEVSSGFNVRGGAVDQNLVLYDGIQVFNNAHVFGFFSIFNSDAIKDATFFKGGVPAEYGGRVSSVLSVTAKEGDYKKWNANGGVGIVSSYLTVGGPIKKDVSSVTISARSSYSDWMLKKVPGKYVDIKNSSVSFYDLSAKLTHKFGANDKISFSGYISKDHFGLPSDTTFVWQNLMGSLHYDHVFNDRLSATMTLGYGQYNYQVDDDDPVTAYEMKYKISYPSLRLDFNYQAGKHKLVFGLNSTYYTLDPGSIRPTSEESNTIPLTLDKQKSLENAVFISDGLDLGEKFHVDLGFRLSMFTAIGPSHVFQYEPGLPLSDNTRTDTVLYNKGQTIKNYIGPEPRVSVRYTLTPNSSVKLGYNRIYQYIHLVSNAVAVTPIDVWQPSNYYFKPQKGDQISLGYYHESKDDMYETSVEGFYKIVDNILDFKDGSQLVLNPALETALLKGTGKSYGVEFALNKTKGRFSGSANYTYSRSLRKVSGPTKEETINNGEYYPSNYDQPNTVNVTWKYGLSKRFALTGNFTYRTGRPVTVPYSYAVIDGIPIVNFSERNEFRVPDYHRLDLALIIEGNHRRKKAWEGSWAISFYNVYARKNVYSIFYKKNEEGIQKAYRMAIIGTVLPSISYRFKF